MSVEHDSYIHRFLNKPGYRQAIGEVFFKIFASGLEIKGDENIPEKGPAIGIFNHMGSTELLILLMLFPELPVVMAKKEVFDNPILSHLLTRLDFFPVARGLVDREALNKAVKVLSQGKFFVTAPEGTRGREREGDRRQLKRAHPGVPYIALRAEQELGYPVPIIPVAIWGGTEWIIPEIDDSAVPIKERLFPKIDDRRLSFKDRLLYRMPINVRVGPAFTLEQRRDLPKLQPLADQLMMELRKLLPQEYHGYYAKEEIAKREARR